MFRAAITVAVQILVGCSIVFKRIIRSHLLCFDVNYLSALCSIIGRRRVLYEDYDLTGCFGVNIVHSQQDLPSLAGNRSEHVTLSCIAQCTH